MLCGLIYEWWGLFYCTWLGLRITNTITLKDYKDLHARDPEDRPANATVGLVPAILSNRISHFFNLKVGLNSPLKSSENEFDVEEGTKHDH